MYQDNQGVDKIFENKETVMDNLSLNNLQEYGSNLMDWAVVFVPKLLMALIIIWLGFKIVNKISQVVGIGLEKANLGTEITEFLKSILSSVMKIMVLGVAASIIGIKMTALIGLLGAAVFAIGMALQGFMGNFASGLTILFLKPYKIGDWIDVDGSFGKVKSIQIFNTTLETPNDKTLIIPNGQVTDNAITNYSTIGDIRLELNVTMPYEESFPRVKQVIEDALKQSSYVKWEKPPMIGIESYDSHNIILAIRPYVDPNHYWDAIFEIHSLVKEGFSKNGVKAAYSEGVELGPIGA